MRILHVQPYFQPKLGYQETYLTRKQTQAGHEVLMITSDRYFPYSNYESTFGPILGNRIVGTGKFEEEGVNVHRLPVHFELSSSGVLVLKGLERACADFQPDAVLCHGALTITAWRMARIKKRLGAAMIFDNHGSDFNTDFTKTLSRRVYRVFLRRIIAPKVTGAADVLVAIGESEKSLLAREFNIDPDTIDVLWLGADTDIFFFDKEAREKTRNSIGIAKDHILIVYAGKWAPQKGLHLLLDAFNSLKEKRNDIHLLLVGGGNEDYVALIKSKVKAESKKNSVTFIDMVPTEKLRDFYSAADIGVWPGISNTILEAMACRLPVIIPEVVSPLTDNKHLLKGGAAIGFDRGDLEKLRKKMETLISEPTLRMETGRKARRLIESELSWDVISKQFVALFKKMIDKKPK